MVAHFDVSREKSLQAIDQAMTEGEKIFLTGQYEIETEDPDAGVIVELKYSRTLDAMENACKKAIAQIKERRYDEYLRNDDRQDILIYGMAFCRKRCKVIVEKL